MPPHPLPEPLFGFLCRLSLWDAPDKRWPPAFGLGEPTGLLYPHAGQRYPAGGASGTLVSGVVAVVVPLAGRESLDANEIRPFPAGGAARPVSGLGASRSDSFVAACVSSLTGLTGSGLRFLRSVTKRMECRRPEPLLPLGYSVTLPVSLGSCGDPSPYFRWRPPVPVVPRHPARFRVPEVVPPVWPSAARRSSWKAIATFLVALRGNAHSGGSGRGVGYPGLGFALLTLP